MIDAHKIQITVKDIDTLSGLNWLRDKIINFYMKMIEARAEADKKTYRVVYSFYTFFYPRLMDTSYSSVKRWTCSPTPWCWCPSTFPGTGVWPL